MSLSLPGSTYKVEAADDTKKPISSIFIVTSLLIVDVLDNTMDDDDDDDDDECKLTVVIEIITFFMLPLSYFHLKYWTSSQILDVI